PDVIEAILRSLPSWNPEHLRQRIRERLGQVCRVECDRAPVATGVLVGPAVVLTAIHYGSAIDWTERRPAGQFRVRFGGAPLGTGPGDGPDTFLSTQVTPIFPANGFEPEYLVLRLDG